MSNWLPGALKVTPSCDDTHCVPLPSHWYDTRMCTHHAHTPPILLTPYCPTLTSHTPSCIHPRGAHALPTPCRTSTHLPSALFALSPPSTLASCPPCTSTLTHPLLHALTLPPSCCLTRPPLPLAHITRPPSRCLDAVSPTPCHTSTSTRSPWYPLCGVLTHPPLPLATWHDHPHAILACEHTRHHIPPLTPSENWVWPGRATKDGV
jgi:hypothetical protein